MTHDEAVTRLREIAADLQDTALSAYSDELVVIANALEGRAEVCAHGLNLDDFCGDCSDRAA